MDTASHTTENGTFTVGEKISAQLCDAPSRVEATIERIELLGNPTWAKFHVVTKRGTASEIYEKDVRKI